MGFHGWVVAARSAVKHVVVPALVVTTLTAKTVQTASHTNPTCAKLLGSARGGSQCVVGCTCNSRATVQRGTSCNSHNNMNARDTKQNNRGAHAQARLTAKQELVDTTAKNTYIIDTTDSNTESALETRCKWSV